MADPFGLRVEDRVSAGQPFDDLAKHLLAGRGVLRLGVVQPLPDLERPLQLVARLDHGLPERLDLGGPVLRLDEVDLLGRIPDALVRRDEQRIGFSRERARLAIALLRLAPALDRPDDEEGTADDHADEQQGQEEAERPASAGLAFTRRRLTRRRLGHRRGRRSAPPPPSRWPLPAPRPRQSPPR